jgi:hypothetical protein
LGILLINFLALLLQFVSPTPIHEEIFKKPAIKPATPKPAVPQAAHFHSPSHSPSKQSRLLFLRSSPMSPKPDTLISRFNKRSEAESPVTEAPRYIQATSPLFSTFQPALKPKISPRKEIIEDGLSLVDAEKSIQQWHVHQYLDVWSENMRKWLSSKLLQPLVTRIDRVDEELSKLGLNNLRCDSITYVESLGPSTSINSDLLF